MYITKSKIGKIMSDEEKMFESLIEDKLVNMVRNKFGMSDFEKPSPAFKAGVSKMVEEMDTKPLDVTKYMSAEEIKNFRKMSKEDKEFEIDYIKTMVTVGNILSKTIPQHSSSSSSPSDIYDNVIAHIENYK